MASRDERIERLEEQVRDLQEVIIKMVKGDPNNTFRNIPPCEGCWVPVDIFFPMQRINIPWENGIKCSVSHTGT